MHPMNAGDVGDICRAIPPGQPRNDNRGQFGGVIANPAAVGPAGREGYDGPAVRPLNPAPAGAVGFRATRRHSAPVNVCPRVAPHRHATAVDAGSYTRETVAKSPAVNWRRRSE
jgi:hypothetical protein